VSVAQKFAVVNPRKAVIIGPSARERALPAMIGEKAQRLVSRVRMAEREARRKQT
jgi:hypothetical protein